MAELNEKSLEQYEFDEHSFELVNENKQIFDQKFDTKPTTYFKDALKRFRKNKSSVAGAIILGILILLALIVPVLSPYDIEDPRVAERFLEPKLFEAGTGFWDGTKKYTNVVVDTTTGRPADFYWPAVFDLKIDENLSYINRATPYGVGGYFMFINEEETLVPTDDHIRFLTSYPMVMTADGGYKAEIVMYEEEYILESALGEYSVSLQYKENEDDLEYSYILIQDYSTEYKNLSVDFSQLLTDAGLDKVYAASLRFDLKAGEGYKTYIMFENITFSSNDGKFYADSKAAADDISKISITDATQTALLKKNDQGIFPAGYWSCSGIKNVYKALVTYCSFTYDTYLAAYDSYEKTVALSTLNDYIAKGWCTYDIKVGPKSFVKLSDECPISSVVSQRKNAIGKVYEVVGEVERFREYGYSEMPKFIFGTDAEGHDLVTKAFTGLRTSLVLGVCTAAFCFLFGLIWGSISGYFGGNVDLAMERFCEILGGVPWIVVMTLCILHLGNNFGTFFLALCLTGWMGTAGRTRTQFYRFKGREYVLASRTLGASDGRLIFRHILPNALGTIVTGAVLMITSTIFSEASLAYLNLGLQGLQSFGVMMSDNQVYLETHSNLVVFPAVIMALMMISFNLFGNGLRDALNPSLKGSE